MEDHLSQRIIQVLFSERSSLSMGPPLPELFFLKYPFENFTCLTKDLKHLHKVVAVLIG